MIEQIVQKIIAAGGLPGAMLVLVVFYFLREQKEAKAIHERQAREMEERYQRNAEELRKVRAEKDEQINRLREQKDEEIRQLQKQKDTEISMLNEARLKDYQTVRELLLSQSEKQIHILAETANAQETTAGMLDNLREQVESLRAELSSRRR